KLNGNFVSADVPPEKRLVDLLREDFGLLKTKGLCYKGQCGSCTVLLNDKSSPSCLLPAFSIKNSEIITAEGFIKTKEYKFIQKFFRSQEYEPCEYCKWGKFFSIYALLKRKSGIDVKDLPDFFSGNQCNCSDMDSFLETVNIILSKKKEVDFDV
ncbi:MAG: 2Fe-2S iron-sulfur cluster binding domain-containing protein, partial [Spirochaetales bacterium]|nr:2Fe-2S iron-sulfur cluster binding domain-containing protein [Spirochaetales bacterium]